MRRQPRSLRPHGPLGVDVSSGLQNASFAPPCTQTVLSTAKRHRLSPHDWVQKSVPSSWLAGKQVIGLPSRSVPQRGSRAAVSQVKTRAWKAASSTEQPIADAGAAIETAAARAVAARALT